MTELLSSGQRDVRWPELLRVHDGDDTASMLGRLISHAQQLLSVTGVSIRLPGPADPLDALLEGETVPAVLARDPGITVLAGVEVAAGLDRLQAALGEGPAVAAAAAGVVVVMDEGVVPRRWPRFAEAAAEVGTHSAASAPLLRPDGSCAGVLTGYSDARLFPDSGVPILQALAAHAAVILETVAIYLGARKTADQLQRAMVATSVIEQAKGVLIMRERISAELADEYLRQTSELTRREIHDVAAELVKRAANGTLR